MASTAVSISAGIPTKNKCVNAQAPPAKEREVDAVALAATKQVNEEPVLEEGESSVVHRPEQ
eukprot:11283407-Prorocentrum_lima.AAC.1